MLISSRIAAVILSGALVFLASDKAAAQASFGAYGVRVSESVNGATAAEGIGVRAAVSFPVFPLEAYAVAEKVFLDCPTSGCSLWALEAGLNLSLLTVPTVKPYLTAGVVRRHYEVTSDGTSLEGISFGAGASAGLPGIRFFLEGRYEFMDDPYDQFVLRLGVMF